MKEIEIKLPVSVEQSMGLMASAVNADTEYETDAYYDTQGRGTLRIRKVEHSGTFETYSTYAVTIKGQKTVSKSGVTSREEVEIGIDYSALSEWEKGFAILGYKLLASVSKRRVSYKPMAGVTVCIDNVQGLGHFVEIEVLAEDEVEASRRIEAVRYMLGLEGIKPETKGYLDLLLQQEAQ
jgi:adenylate cyclase, class 2